MTLNQRLFTSKIITFTLILLLTWGNSGILAQEMEDNDFQRAMGYYRLGQYEAAGDILEKIIEKGISPTPMSEAQTYLLLGTCFEMMEKVDRATSCYQKIKSMIDGGFIIQVPAISGINFESFKIFREILGEKGLFQYQTPVSVSDVLQSHVIHSERLSLQDLRYKRRFNWKVAAGGLVLGTAIVLLTVIKKKNKIAQFKEIDWVRVPAGEFMMGDNLNEGEPDEQPVHPIYLDEYEMSKYEITMGQYNVFSRETGRPLAGVQFNSETQRFADDHPALGVSWEDATAFCQWVSQKTGQNIKLPTEAQWEKAARGTDQRRFPWGDGFPNCNMASFYGCGSQATSAGKIRIVGGFSSGQSPYGIFDMAGNVAEWCRDIYSPNYYSQSPYNNPCGPDNDRRRVVRGGSVTNSAATLRSANRFHYDASNKSDYIGFRVVREK